MLRRSWRNFDYLLLIVLLALSALGVTMIYSATTNTLGVENPVQRQIIYIAAGMVLMVITASLDYRLLELLQHPFSFLAPLVLALGTAGLLMAWRAQQLQLAEHELTGAQLLVDLPAMLLTLVSIAAVYLLDRFWIEELDLPAVRVAAIGAVVIAAGAGLYMLWSAEAGRIESLIPYVLAAGVAVVYLLDCLTLRFTDMLRNPLYVMVLAMLGVILVAGQVAGGSQRWLGEGTVQPSELAKILVIVVLAKFLADNDEHLGRFTTVLTSLGIIGLPVALIYLQPDLDLALVASWAAMMWMSAIRLRHILLLGILGTAALPLGWFALNDYMRDRLMVFFNPASDPDSYFNVHQSLVSIGSGGLTGKGLTQGTQSQLHFLRVRHTDFIFAVTAEELGFLGATLLIFLMGILLWRLTRVAERSRDSFGRFLASGIAGLVLFQTVVNIGMNLGIMPVTGVPLPFVSYGGSSYVTLMLGIGIVESVAMRHKKLEFD